jgi:hypothetical protein
MESIQDLVKNNDEKHGRNPWDKTSELVKLKLVTF